MKIHLLLIPFVITSNFYAAINNFDESQCIEQASRIEEKLACLSNVQDINEVVGNKYLPNDMRQFEMTITQAVNIEQPSLGHFKQKIVLLHRDENEPMVLQTSGYEIFWVAQTAITSTFKTNQIQIEHRFFDVSVPEPNDWTQLNIKQSADDFHNVTTTFKKIYKKSWVGTGASKGGMTSTYHRFFYPHDLCGTVADVAPLSFSTSDKRYDTFVNNVGGDAYAECRQNWADMQKILLENRDLFLPRLQGGFTILGSVDVAFEHAIIESVFTFWQYGNPDDPLTGCSAIPVNGTIQDIYNFVFKHVSLNFFNDESIKMFYPYFYQAATELGAPGNVNNHLEHLRWYHYDISQYVPQGINIYYSNAHMRAIDRWARTYADNIMYIYGEFDPWTAAEYPLSETGKSITKYYVPKGNHGSKFTALKPDDRQKAIDTLSVWLDKSSEQNLNSKFAMQNKSQDIYLEDLEYQVRKNRNIL